MIEKLPNAPKSPIKFWGIVLGIPLVFIISIVIMFAYQGSTKPILDMANQFNPGDGWMLESEQVEPPRIVCLNSVPCPSVHKVWVSEVDIDKEEFFKYLDNAKWSHYTEGDCMRQDNVSGSGVVVCEAEVTKGKFIADIRLIKSASNTKSTLVLEVKK